MATSNEKQVQLKRESLLNDEVVLEDVFPKTVTDAVTDINTGAKMSEVLDTIMTVINNKLSRNVNSVNGRSGVVLLDASDVGLGNVDNVSTADLKAWVINYVASQFHDKHLILQEYYSGIQALIDTNNDAYDGVPFVCRHYTEDSNDETMVIGYMVNDGNHLTSQYYTFNFGDKGVGRFEYDSNGNVLGEYFNVYEGNNRNQAIGLYSTAKGFNNITEGQASLVIGNTNIVGPNAENSFVSGSNNKAQGGDNCIIFGRNNTMFNSSNRGFGNLIGGYNNKIKYQSSSIILGSANEVGEGDGNIIAGNNLQIGSIDSINVSNVDCSIIAGQYNQIDDATGGTNRSTASIMCGKSNYAYGNPWNSIMCGEHNTMDTVQNSLVVGYYNGGTNTFNSILSGEYNTMKAANSIVAGVYNVISTLFDSSGFACGKKLESKGENSFIIGLSSNGFNPVQVGTESHHIRYNGILNMSVSEMISTFKDTPFSIAYGDSSFVAGEDNLGIGDVSFTIGNKNINESTKSFVSGVNNRAGSVQGITISGSNNFILGQFSNGSGLRNTTTGHVANVSGAFNNAGNYETVIGVGSTTDEYLINTRHDVNLHFNTGFVGSDVEKHPPMKAWLIRKAEYIDIPVPLIFRPIKAKNMVFKLKYQNTNEWSGNTTVEHIIAETGDSIFSWQEDIKAIRISRDALNTQFGFNHSVTPGETSYELDVLDLRDVDFEIDITFEPNYAERIGLNAFKVGNGPFADNVYCDDVSRANAFEVRWDGTTLTQKDIQLRYKANPNTADAPIDISFKKLVDVLISNGTINLNDIVSI